MKKILMRVLLLLFSVQSPYNGLSAANECSNRRKEVYTERATAVARLALASTQVYTQEFQSLSPHAQASINIATSLLRIANALSQESVSEGLGVFRLINAGWTAYDMVDLANNVTCLTTGSTPSKKSLPKIHKICRVLAAFIEGTTALASSFDEKIENQKAFRIRMQTACSLARSIERSLAAETDEGKKIMAAAALANIALFVYTCIESFEEPASDYEKYRANKHKKNMLELIQQYEEAIKQGRSIEAFHLHKEIELYKERSYTSFRKGISSKVRREINNEYAAALKRINANTEQKQIFKDICEKVKKEKREKSIGYLEQEAFNRKESAQEEYDQAEANLKKARSARKRLKSRSETDIAAKDKAIEIAENNLRRKYSILQATERESNYWRSPIRVSRSPYSDDSSISTY